MKQKVLITLLFFCSSVSLAQKEYDSQKLSSYLTDLANMYSAATSRGLQMKEKSVCTLLKVCKDASATDVASKYDCQVLDSIGGVYFVRVPVNRLGSLSLDQSVLRIEAHEIPQPMMDEAPVHIGANKVWRGENLQQAFTGKGVITGITDIGFDFTHLMFQDSTGGSRIMQFFDMGKGDEEGQGTAYDADALEEMKFSVRGKHQTHGTHVSSLMSGSPVKGNKGLYSGIAYESDIILSEVGVSPIDSTDYNSSTSASILLGLKKLFDYADKAEMPCVINLSMGGWCSFFDSTELEDQVVSEMTGPGKILVSSAGNDGQYHALLSKPDSVFEVTARFLGDPMDNSGSTQSKAKDIKCTLLSSDSQKIEFDFFGLGGPITGGEIVQDSIVLNTDTLDLLNGEPFTKSVRVNRAEATVTAYRITRPPSFITANAYQFIIQLAFDGFYGSFSQWIRYHGVEISVASNNPCEIITNPQLTPFTYSQIKDSEKTRKCFSSSYTIGWPASSDDVIAVGALNRHDNMLANFSSQGPTWDNRIKPDVMAPGEAIRGAYNRFCSSFEKDQSNFCDTVYDFTGNEHYMIAYDGTSMSCPIVAGTIAMWLQAKPDLTPLDIKEVLAHTSRHIADDRIDYYPNNMYGFGEIDAYAGLLYILGIGSKIEGISMNQPVSVRIKLEGRSLTVIDAVTESPFEDDIQLVLYSIDGKRVVSCTHNNLDLSNLSKGVYVVQISSRRPCATGSTLIRL